MFVYFQEEETTSETCEFHYFNNETTLPFVCDKRGSIFLSYARSPFFKSKESAINEIRELHSLGILFFKDKDQIPSFVEDTWPQDVDLIRDFENKNLGKFSLESITRHKLSASESYPSYMLEYLDRWPEYVLDTGEYIEENMAIVYHDSCGILNDQVYQDNKLEQVLEDLLEIFLMREGYIGSQEVLAGDEVKEILQTLISNIINTHFDDWFLDFTFSGDEIILSNEKDCIYPYITKLGKYPSQQHISEIKEELKKLRPHFFTAKGNFRIIEIEFKYNTEGGDVDCIKSINKLLRELRHKTQTSIITIDDSAFCIPEISISKEIDLEDLVKLSEPNKFKARFCFSLSVY